MTETKQHQLDELSVTDILSYLGARVSSVEEDTRRNRKQLIKAKEHIRKLLDFIKAKENGDSRIPTPYFYEEYEQFLKEV